MKQVREGDQARQGEVLRPFVLGDVRLGEHAEGNLLAETLSRLAVQQVVPHGLAPLSEQVVAQGQKQRPHAGRDHFFRPPVKSHHRRIDLRRGVERATFDREQDFHLIIKLREDRKRGPHLGARLRGKPLCHLKLQGEYHYLGKALCLQQAGDTYGTHIVWQIAAYGVWRTGTFEHRRPCFQRIALDQAETLMAGERLVPQDPAETMVDLECGDTRSGEEQLLGQSTDARTDLPDVTIGDLAETAGDAAQRVFGDEEVLSEFLRHRKGVFLEQARDRAR